MDSKFADLMAEVGQIDSDTLNRRWEAVVRVADGADAHQKARLILIASGDEVDRDADGWFWEPFRAVEDTFRVDDAAELHSRLAHAAARRIVGSGDALAAVLVRLAQLNARHFVGDDLISDARVAMEQTVDAIPAASPFKNYWTNTVRDALKPGAGPDPTIIATHLSTVAAQSQAALTELYRYVTALTEWAGDIESRLSSGQRLIEWLLAGVRADGRSWSDLHPVEVAVDAAVELSDFLYSAPQPHHESLLAQVLAVAAVEESPVSGKANGVRAHFSAADSSAFAALTPLTSALAAGSDLVPLAPVKLSVRVLWEAAARKTWDLQ